MATAAQRLSANIQKSFTAIPVTTNQEVNDFVLPDGVLMTVRATLAQDTAPGDLSTKSVHIGELVVCDYRVLERTAQLVISAVGTKFEHNVSHVPSFQVIQVLPPTTDSPHISSSHDVSVKDMWTTVYALFTLYHAQETIPILLSQQIGNGQELRSYLLQSGLGRLAHASASSEEIYLHRATFWQGAGIHGYHTRSWLPPSSMSPLAVAPFPYIQSFTRTSTVIAAHPLRPPKPRPGQVLYRRYFPSIGETLEFTYFDPGNGLDTSEHFEAFHRWHNSERVNAGWGERGSMEEHRAYIKGIMDDTADFPVIMSWNGECMGYAEITYLKENHVAPYIPGGPGDWDRGLHILVGEERFRGGHRSRLWHCALIHYCFLADPRTENVMSEPKASNSSVLKLELESSMHFTTLFDFPYKRSVLACTTRERFFRLDML